jgi:ribonuclease HI
MKNSLLNVYTDASADQIRGAVAFSVWDKTECLGRLSLVVNDRTLSESTILELIAIREALSWVCEHYPGRKVKLITDSDAAYGYIKHKEQDKQPYRSIADEIISLDLISEYVVIKSHTHNRARDYIRNDDVDGLANEARENNLRGLVSHSTDVRLYKQKSLADDTELLKPVNARDLVKRYYVEKEIKEPAVSVCKTAIVSGVKPEMSPSEKFAARFGRFKK